MKINRLRIGLDIDDCLAGFWEAYCNYFDTANNPKMLKDEIITKNVQNILRHDRSFWLDLPVINRPDFEPELYCTKRVINKNWTKAWLRNNGFPDKPVYQMYLQSGNKANMIKGKVDLFIDDSLSNVIKMNNSGVPTLLYHTERTKDIPYAKVYSLDKDHIIDTYLLMKTYA